ncbi:hypothetical protein CLV92_111139 [Kineococcus xinjiangensis]|uniref:Deazaflavin-dependent oxidoreductase (Nitroreductase family) n=1 Tax=Kineococcus xinjiangensis TaxID=512762 RepID=A0A2S6IG80_9ACTN|nr:grhN [Kineococcus xinjiangensis]PPK93222.1 hypothetical protein CLV92_111139 [Kineococcus xinjiangensis]
MEHSEGARPAEAIQDRRPPRWFIDRVANPVVRRLAPSRLGRRLPVAVLTFTGRRSGRRFDVPVAVHQVDDQRVVFAAGAWRVNFRGGADAQLLAEGRSTPVHVTLLEDPADVGAVFRAAFDTGITPEKIALRIPSGSQPTDEELAAHRRILVLR